MISSSRDLRLSNYADVFDSRVVTRDGLIMCSPLACDNNLSEAFFHWCFSGVSVTSLYRNVAHLTEELCPWYGNKEPRSASQTNLISWAGDAGQKLHLDQGV